MTLKLKVISIGSLFLVFLITGCDKAPEKKLSATKDAISQAKTNGATEYAKQEIDSAQDALDNAINMVQVESKKFSFLRNYSEATKLLDIAEKMAVKASDIANLEKEQIRAELEKAQQESAKKKDAAKKQQSKRK